MKPSFILLCLLTLFAFQRKATDGEAVIVNRIRYIYNLKQQIDKDVWKGFAGKEFDLPLVYYTDSVCYIANPTPKFLSIYPSERIAGSRGLRIYKTRLLDSIPFHMETGMIFGNGTSAYNYRSPFMNCSSLEITQKVIPDVGSTEVWATMVIHEYFHGYQFKHPAYIAYFEQNIAMASDTLTKVYKAYPWFKESVDQENERLLAALEAADERQTRQQIDAFFALRAKRRLKARQTLPGDLAETERSYETMEGTARYVEYSLYQTFGQKKPDRALLRSDTAYRAYDYFWNYTITRDPWLYRSEETTYFYATGFNLVRLLDKLKVRYKTRLFREAGVSLEQILQEYQAGTKPNRGEG